jgi:gluconokinase
MEVLPKILIVMGVAGAGKSTIGSELARQLGWHFYDADDFHPETNVRKMAQGQALTDCDRAPWLVRLRALIETYIRRDLRAVIACSALRKAYRDVLTVDPRIVRFAFLSGPRELIARRLASRTGHFFNPKLLSSQFDTLEMPDDAIVANISDSPPQIAKALIRQIFPTDPG